MPHRKRKAGRRPSQVSTGTIHVARKGYGFVDTPDGEYFVLRGYLHGAMDGDLVEVVRLRKLEQRRRDIRVQDWKLPRDQRGRDRERLGSVRRVLERAHTTVVGTLIDRDGIRVVRPHDVRIDHDIFLDMRAISKPAVDGDVVVVRITTYPTRLESAAGYIEEVVGHVDEQGIDIEVIIREHGFETVFSAAALEELADLEVESGSSLSAAASDEATVPTPVPTLERRDLRDRFIFTIDPADAKDFDDALSVDFINGQLRLGVHIADVSAYVAWDSALDFNARRRATSVYLPDRVIPMLPPRLSDDLCSLRPDTDRLAFTVDLMMNNDGSVESCEFYPSLIHSVRRLSYGQAQEYLDAPEDPPLAHDEVHQRLTTLNRLAHALTRRRRQRGAIDFEGTEAKVELDDDGRPLAVHLRRQTEATTLVEEAMILANEQVASYLLAREAPMVYRIHEAPWPGALAELLPTLQEFGYARQGAPQSSAEVQRILDESKGRPEYALVSQLLLRAMKRAAYAPYWTEHYGLASRAYAHFTSPIRRYPDLMVHRLLKHALLLEQTEALERTAQSSYDQASALSGGAGDAARYEAKLKLAQARASFVGLTEQMQAMCVQLVRIAEQSSRQEREAEAATREATALKLAEYLSGREGECFAALIVGINSYGLYVREETTLAEGFVDARDLPEGCVCEPERYRWRNPDTQVAYRLGAPVEVQLVEVERPNMRLRFVIA